VVVKMVEVADVDVLVVVELADFSNVADVSVPVKVGEVDEIACVLVTVEMRVIGVVLVVAVLI